MLTKKIIFLAIGILAIGAVAYLFINGFGKVKLASLEVAANQKAPMYIDGKEVGMTPYNGTFEAKNVDVKVLGFETNVFLQPGIKTVIERDFGNDLLSSSGFVVSFEVTGDPSGTLAVVTNPDGATVNLDGAKKGFTPLNIEQLSAGTHQLDVGVDGFDNRNFSINI